MPSAWCNGRSIVGNFPRIFSHLAIAGHRRAVATAVDRGDDDRGSKKRVCGRKINRTRRTYIRGEPIENPQKIPYKSHPDCHVILNLEYLLTLMKRRVDDGQIRRWALNGKKKKKKKRAANEARAMERATNYNSTLKRSAHFAF